jgi:hypothetical protein
MCVCVRGKAILGYMCVCVCVCHRLIWLRVTISLLSGVVNSGIGHLVRTLRDKSLDRNPVWNIEQLAPTVRDQYNATTEHL